MISVEPPPPARPSPCSEQAPGDPALTSLLLEAIKDLCQSESASILAVQPDGSLSFALACGGAADQLVGTRIDPEQCVAGRVLKTMVPEIVSVPSKTALQIEEQHGYRTRSMLVAPLVDRVGRLFGVAEAVNPVRGGFQSAHLEALRSISTPLADAMRAIEDHERDPEAISRFYAAVVEVMRARGAGLKDENEELHGTRCAFELDRARRYSDEKMVSLARLACGVAHEINNPLSAAQSGLATAAEVGRDLQSRLLCPSARKQTTSAEVAELLNDLDEIAKDARESLARIARIVHRLAAFGELEPGRLEEVSLADEVHRMAELLQLRPETEAPVPIDVDAGDVPLIVACRTRVRQVLVEVLDNAVRAARARADEGRVQIAAFADAELLHVIIADNGPGIPSASQGRVFDPFFTTKTEWRAVGLGLTAAYGIVRALGGSISVESAEGRGTTVTITLPRGASPSAKATPPRPRTGRYYEDLR